MRKLLSALLSGMPLLVSSVHSSLLPFVCCCFLECDSRRSMQLPAPRASSDFGPEMKHWASPDGLSGRCGLSIWSEAGSSLIPLSLGDGDQRGEPDTESPPPVSRALRKSPFAGPFCCTTWRFGGTMIRPQQRRGHKNRRAMAEENFKLGKHCRETIRLIFFSMVLRTFGSCGIQVWWFPWCPAAWWPRLPAFWSNSHSSFSPPLFWSKSQSSRSVSSHPP